MVKGVNKTVIVVNDTGNEMFEKIVFYVTPKYGKANIKELKQAAGELSSTFDCTKTKAKNTLRRKYAIRRFAILCCLLLGLGSAVTVALFLIF